MPEVQELRVIAWLRCGSALGKQQVADMGWAAHFELNTRRVSAARGAAQVPSKEQVAGVTADLAARAALPAHLPGVLAALPKDTHPMVQFSTAVLALQVRPRLTPYHRAARMRPAMLSFADA